MHGSNSCVISVSEGVVLEYDSLQHQMECLLYMTLLQPQTPAVIVLVLNSASTIGNCNIYIKSLGFVFFMTLQVGTSML